ncbi:hypothetical protein [Sphingobacterium tabacisoli]|uniref:Uncharacterized protein n=1 Tax=Sphingobacterium tabacisoli TaxID=2044855 RepID=A0ABW5L7M7_9SPHI|nr:hypothetical protein [Sphingobacterium tabacisoli]
MISTITPLQEAIEQQLVATNQGLPWPELPIDELCIQVLSDMTVLFRRINTPKMASQVINQCYVAISGLLDQIWSTPSLFVHFKAMEKLYFRFELSFSLYLLAGNTPPLYLQQQLSGEVERRLPAICSKLAKKEVPKSYILELQYALKSLFNPCKQPSCNYAHLSYLPQLLNALEEIAHDDRDKAWTERFIFLMIRFNFNYPGFFNRWSEELTDALELLGTVRERQLHLFRIESQLNLSYHSSDLCYNLYQEPLLEQMRLYINVIIEKLEHSPDDITLEEDTALLTRLSGDELNFLFYYFYKAKIFDYPSKREAAKAFSTFIYSKTNRRISYKTLEKFDKAALEASVNKMRRLLTSIIKAIDDDFRT